MKQLDKGGFFVTKQGGEPCFVKHDTSSNSFCKVKQKKHPCKYFVLKMAIFFKIFSSSASAGLARHFH